eukprot:s909_g12.t1
MSQLMGSGGDGRSEMMQTPLFTADQVRQFEELHRRAPWIYGQTDYVPRPMWLDEEMNRRVQEDKLRDQEMRQILRRLQDLEVENAVLKQQVEETRTPSKYGTPEDKGSRDPQKDSVYPLTGGGFEAAGRQEAASHQEQAAGRQEAASHREQAAGRREAAGHQEEAAGRPTKKRLHATGMRQRANEKRMRSQRSKIWEEACPRSSCSS